MKHVFATLCVAFVLSISTARANCGSSSCPIDLNALQKIDDARFTIDLSLQYIDQDQLRIGTRKAHVGEIASDHDEIRTINRITSLQLNYAINDRVQVGLTAPYISRFHRHFDTDALEMERWSFGSPGDVTAQGRLRVRRSSLWIVGALKLPTGDREEVSDTGEDAEVTIAPGSGSTDGAIGLTWSSGFVRGTTLKGMLGRNTLIPFFVTATVRVNGRGTDEYRKGNEIQLNTGTEYPLTSALHVLGQINGRILANDDVGHTDEERDLTGGRFLYISPGLRWLMRGGTSIYGFVQVPIYQRVNGLQLTSDANYLVGMHQTF